MHTIRLRKPWEKQLGDGSIVRVDVPDDDVPDDDVSDDDVSDDDVSDDDGSFDGPVVYRRRFNRPTGLEGNVVHLQVAGWQGRLRSLLLNGQSVNVAASPVKVDVTDQLQRQNEIELTLSGDGHRPARLSGAVTLTISEVNPGS